MERERSIFYTDTDRLQDIKQQTTFHSLLLFKKTKDAAMKTLSSSISF